MGTISVSNLGKAYKQYPTRWSRLREWLTPGNKQCHQLKWILQDINFTVRPGEAVGIIGINGAGKSTLLKLITGTAQPTTGGVHMTGRVAAMLELGMGFHPDFTGRQNAYMAGQLLGMSAEEISQLMPEIEAFAEIGDYIDEPVRVYSSGMQVRLAFSVATAIRPDILIIDEALSVGDAYFQHKSFDRIREFRVKGTTLLIVSHDKQAIQSVCDRAILLDLGRISMEGAPEAVMDYYSAMLSNSTREVQTIVRKKETDGRIDSGTFEAEILGVDLINEEGLSADPVKVGEALVAKITVRVNEDIEGLVLGFGIKDRLGQMIFGTNTLHTNQKIIAAHAGDVFKFNVSFQANLGVGSYSIHCSIVADDSYLDKTYHWIDRAKIFSVINVGKPLFIGCSWNEMKFHVHAENYPLSDRDE